LSYQGTQIIILSIYTLVLNFFYLLHTETYIS